MQNFKKTFGSLRGGNIISLDGNIPRIKTAPNAFSLNQRPIVFKTKSDLVREAPPKSTIVVPSTKKIKKPISKTPSSTFKTQPLPKVLESPPLVEKITPKSVVVIDRETKQLSSLDPIDFKKSGEIVLTGDVETNKIKFDRYSLDDIKAVDSVTFEFILRLATFSGQFYFTSTTFKNKLEAAYNDNLPYMALEALKPGSVVSVDLRPILDSLSDYSREEQKDGVIVKYNTFVDAAGNVDFTKILEYIDWVVSKPPTNYDDRIIPAETLGNWEIVGGIDAGNGTTVPKSSGTAVPTKMQESVSEPKVVNEIKDEPKPIKKLPVKANVEPPKTLISGIINESLNTPGKIFPVASGVLIRDGVVQESFTDTMTRGQIPLVNLPKIDFPPNRFVNGQLNFTEAEKNKLKTGISDLFKGQGLVPSITVPKLNLPDLTGVDWSNIDLSKLDKN